jgi:hypothetical protein
MKLVNQILAFLLLSLFLFSACSEESNLTQESQPERLAKAYLKGQMPNLEGAGMMNILPPNDSLRYAFENDLELKSREVARAQLLLAAEGDWPAMNKIYRDFLSESKASPHAWYEQQVAANQALYQLFVHFPEETRNPKDVIFYTKILMDWECANAWRLAQSLTFLQAHWSEEQIREVALICLHSPALPAIEDLQKKVTDESTMPFLRDMMKRQLAGMKMLNEFSQVNN